jgi:hypothetical protein
MFVMVQYSKLFCNRVIHPCALCLCLQNYGWWVFNECPIPTKTPKQTLNHIIVRWNIDLLNTKGFKGCRIDWLVWRLTTTIAHHYMHTLEMKKIGFIKNKIVEAIVTQSVEKTTLIPLTHVYQPTLESDGASGQHLPNVTYAMKFLFTKLSCSTCEWAL